MRKIKIMDKKRMNKMNKINLYNKLMSKTNLMNKVLKIINKKIRNNRFKMKNKNKNTA